MFGRCARLHHFDEEILVAQLVDVVEVLGFPNHVVLLALDPLVDKLLPDHFAEHRDIGFYASELHISPAYLSRIVRQVAGRTVMDYVNQMLLMEASFLLRTTTLSVAQIADRLHFADSASFCKFFSRTKGLTPKEFRKQ